VIPYPTATKDPKKGQPQSAGCPFLLAGDPGFEPGASHYQIILNISVLFIQRLGGMA
jgi:hypothetical protein